MRCSSPMVRGLLFLLLCQRLACQSSRVSSEDKRQTGRVEIVKIVQGSSPKLMETFAKSCQRRQLYWLASKTANLFGLFGWRSVWTHLGLCFRADWLDVGNDIPAFDRSANSRTELHRYYVRCWAGRQLDKSTVAACDSMICKDWVRTMDSMDCWGYWRREVTNWRNWGHWVGESGCTKRRTCYWPTSHHSCQPTGLHDSMRLGSSKWASKDSELAVFSWHRPSISDLHRFSTQQTTGRYFMLVGSLAQATRTGTLSLVRSCWCWWNSQTRQ